MESVLEVFRCIRLKFGQNRVSNSWDIWCGVLVLVVVVLVTGVKQSQLQVLILRLKFDKKKYSWFMFCLSCGVCVFTYACNKRGQKHESAKFKYRLAGSFANLGPGQHTRPGQEVNFWLFTAFRAYIYGRG